MILHILPDDKFIDMAYDMFEKASPQNNLFIVETNRKSFKYIKNSAVKKISSFEISSKKFIDSLKDYEFIVIHWLDDMKLSIIQKADSSVKFLWIGWGGDYYQYIQQELLMSKTKHLKEILFKQHRQSFLPKAKSYIKKFLLTSKIDNLENVINKIDYFAPVLSSEYELVAKNFNNFKPKYLEWNYGTIDDNIVGIQDMDESSINILLGNSATFENNHLEAFSMLEMLNIEDKKIICPLSYGDDIYTKEIIKVGYKKFGNRFEPLLEFMTLEQYNSIISTCSVVIMNHLRQQALGNITVMMYAGAKIFINKKNPIYDHYLKMGAIIFSMDELNDVSICKRLTKDEIELNQKVLQDNFNNNAMLQKTKALIVKLNELKK